MQLKIGFSLFALFVGFTVGASNSPVVAPFLTATFGLIGTIVGIDFVSLIGKKDTVNYKSVGISISLVAVFLFVGTICGEMYRTNFIFSEEKSLPWGALSPPANTKEALDWIVVKERMNNLGYSDSQVEELYRIRAEEIIELKKIIQLEEEMEIDSFDRTVLYSKNAPFHSMFPNDVKRAASGSRGPASE